MKHIKLLLSIFVFMLLASASSHATIFQNITLNGAEFENNSFFNTSSLVFNATTNIDYSKIYYSLRDNSQDLEFNNGNLTNFETNNGAVNGGVTISEDGALSNNGSTGRVQLPDTLPVNNIIYIGIWVNQATQTGNFRRLIELGGFSSGGYSVQSSSTSNPQQLNFYLGSSNGWSNLITSTLPALNQWVYYEAMYDGTTASVFHNLTLVESKNMVFHNVTGTNRRYLLNDYNGKANFIIMDRIPTNDERTQIYNAGHQVYSPIGNGLVAQYTGKDFAGTPENPTIIYDTNYIVENNGSRGISFDGVNDRVKLGGNPYNQVTGVLTVSSSFNTPDNNFKIITGGSNIDSVNIYLKSDNKAVCQIRDSGGNYNSVSSINDYNVNQNNIIICEFDMINQEISITLNNGTTSTISTVTNQGATSMDSYIGTRRTFDPHFKGSIYNFQIHNKSLNSTQRTQVFNGEIVRDGLIYAQGDVNPAKQTLYDRVENICIICKSGIETLTNLVEETYNIAFLAYQGASETISDFFSFTVDLTPPTITNNIPNEINDYIFNLSQFLNISDSSGISTSYINFTTTNQLFNFTNYIGYDITTLINTNNTLNVGSQGAIYGITFNDDGTKLFTVEDPIDRIREYICTTPYDITSCSSNSFISPPAGSARGITFNNLGTKMYVAELQFDRIHEYVCTTPYDITSCSTNSFISAPTATPRDIEFNNVGTKMYITESLGDSVVEYTCSTAFQLSTCSTNGNTLSISSQDSIPVSAQFNNDGTELFVLGDGNNKLFQYNCSTAYDLSTCTYSSISEDLPADTLQGIFFGDFGTKFYVVSQSTLYEYNLDKVKTGSINIPTQIQLIQNGIINYTIFANDTSGNSITTSGQILVNPPFKVYFSNNTDLLTNFFVDGVLYNEFFSGNVYDYGLGEHTFLFQKGGFEEFNFTLNFTNNISLNTLNYTFFTEPVFITLNLLNALNASPAPLDNYLIFITETSTGNIESYQLNNNNSIIFQNNYIQNTEIKIGVVLNTSLSNTIELVTARQNVTLNVFLTFETTAPRIIEVLSPSLSVIPNNDVYLYRFISGEGFVLETIKKTNVLGQVFFNIVENSAIYNICSIYEGNEKCLNQITFSNIETDDFQIIHENLNVPVELLNPLFISWSFNEIKNETLNTSQITFTFNDKQNLVSRFCLQVTRYDEDNSPSNIGEFCNNNPNGQIVQTFLLGENEYIEYLFFYELNGQNYELTTYITYGENALLNQFLNLNYLNILFLIMIFGLISTLLSFGNLSVYNIGFLGGLLIVLSFQSYFNESYLTAGLWLLLATKTVVLYYSKVER